MRLNACAVITICLCTNVVAGQELVSGRVVDSLRGGAPIPGAQVRVLGDAQTAVTDVNGHFRLSARTTGTVAVLWWAPRLDSLGLNGLRVDLGTSQPTNGLVLSTPSARGLFRLHCGHEPAEEETVLIGRVTDITGSPLPGAIAWVSWIALRARGTNVEQSLRASVDTADADGLIAVCGVPHGQTVYLEAQAGERRTGERALTIEDWVPFATIRAARARERRIIRGFASAGSAADSAPRSVASGTVRVAGDTASVAATIVDGRFSIEVTAGSVDLDLRAVGFQPRRLAVPDDLGDSVLRVSLAPTAPLLDTVRVRGRLDERKLADFEARRRRGMGRFITDSMLATFPRATAHGVASLVSGVQAAGGMYPALRIRGGAGFCDPRIFDDGSDRGKMTSIGDRVDLAALLERAARIEIYTAATAPPEFADFDGCGAVVIWSR